MALPAVAAAAGKAVASAAAKEAGKSAVKTAAKETARGAAKNAVKDASIKAAKTAGKEAAKNTAKQAASNAIRDARSNVNVSSVASGDASNENHRDDFYTGGQADETSQSNEYERADTSQSYSSVSQKASKNYLGDQHSAQAPRTRSTQFSDSGNGGNTLHVNPVDDDHAGDTGSAYGGVRANKQAGRGDGLRAESASGMSDSIRSARNALHSVAEDAFRNTPPEKILAAGNAAADLLRGQRAERNDWAQGKRGNSRGANSLNGLPKPHVAAGSLGGLAAKPVSKRAKNAAGAGTASSPIAGADIGKVLDDASKAVKQATRAQPGVSSGARDTLGRSGKAGTTSGWSDSAPDCSTGGENNKQKPGGLKNKKNAPLRGALRGGAVVASLPFIIPLLLVMLPVLLIGGCAMSFTASSGDGVGSGSNSVLEQSQGVFIPSINTVTANSNEVNNAKAVASGSFDSSWCYYDQSDPKWDTRDDANNGVGAKENWKSGCGVVSYAMVLSSYSKDSKYTPSWCASNGLSSGIAIMEAPMLSYVNDHQDIFHLKASAGHRVGNDGSDGNIWKENWDRVKSVTNAGGCVMISSDRVGTTSGGHYVVITKVENGTVTFKNPWGGVEETATEDYVKNAGYDCWGNSTLTIWFEKV